MRVTNERSPPRRRSEASRARPGRLIVTACAPDRAESFAAGPVTPCSQSRKFDPASFLADGGRVRVSDIMAVRETAPHLVTGFAERSRAFVEVQNGCDHRCTFCIIPYGRGNSRSAPAGLVVEKVKRLVGEGFGEVVLRVYVTSYGPIAGAASLACSRGAPGGVPDLPRLPSPRSTDARMKGWRRSSPGAALHAPSI